MNNNNINDVFKDMLKSTPLMNDLKKEIRQRLAYECQKKMLMKKNKFAIEYDKTRKGIIHGSDSNGLLPLIMNHLEFRGFEYSRSMLSLESSCTSQICHTDHILSSLGLGRNDPFCKTIDALLKESSSSSLSYLDALVEGMKRWFSKGYKEISIQTDENDQLNLDNVLRSIDQTNYILKMKVHADLKSQFESELLKTKEELELEYRNKYESQIETMRKIEINRIKFEYENRANENLISKEKQLLELHQMKMRALQDHESILAEKHAEIKKNEQSEIYLRRQLLLSQSSEIEGKKNQLENEAQLLESKRKEQEINFERQFEEITRMRTEIEQAKKLFELKVMDRVEELRIADKKKVNHENMEIAHLKNELEVAKLELAKDISTAKQRVAEANKIREKFTDMEITDYNSIKSQNDILQVENRTLNSHLQKVLSELEKLRIQKAECESNITIKDQLASQVPLLRHELEQEKLSKIKELDSLKDINSELRLNIVELKKKISRYELIIEKSSQNLNSNDKIIKVEHEALSDTKDESGSVFKNLEQTRRKIELLDKESAEIDKQFREWTATINLDPSRYMIESENSLKKYMNFDRDISSSFNFPFSFDMQSYANYLKSQYDLEKTDEELLKDIHNEITQSEPLQEIITSSQRKSYKEMNEEITQKQQENQLNPDLSLPTSEKPFKFDETLNFSLEDTIKKINEPNKVSEIDLNTSLTKLQNSKVKFANFLSKNNEQWDKTEEETQNNESHSDKIIHNSSNEADSSSDGFW